MNVYMVNSSYEGCCYIRIMLPTFHNGFVSNKSSLTAKIDSPKKMQEMLTGADIVVFHRPETPEFYDLAKILKSEGKKIVVDNDDTFKIDDYHPLAEFKPDAVAVGLKSRNEAMDKFLTIADLVTTTTKTLAEEYRKLNDNVIILPNCVDPMDWDEPLRNEGKKVRIGMVGSVAFEYDYLHIKDILRGLDKREDVQLVMFGLGSKEHREQNQNITKAFAEEYKFWDSLGIEQIPWCPRKDYPRILNEARLDIMLIPRKDNYFNRCKSNIKFLEAAMCEIPCICQSFDNGPYEEIEYLKALGTGLLVKDNNHWMSEINKLITDKTMRRQIGKNAKEYTLNNYNIECSAPMWEDAYKQLYGN